MRIFITGGHGFLGTSLVSRLRGLGHDCHAPTSRECNLLDPQDLRRFPKGHYDRIFHLAAWTQAGDFCLRHPGEQWIINQKLNTHLLEWWLSDQPQAHLVFMGTSCAYAPGSELIEPNYMAGEPIDSLYTYAMTKRMLLQGARALSKQYGLKWLCAVPSTLYGPDYHTDGRQMHFVFDLVRKILRGKHFGEPVVLWGDGYQRRELVYVDDFINALGIVADVMENDLINIGAGQDFQIREFADAICAAVEFDASAIQYDVTRYVGAQAKKLSIKRLVGLYPEYTQRQLPLREGLRRVVDWFEREKAYGNPA